MTDRQIIPGLAGQLEALIDVPSDWNESKPTAIICHPHPLHGGSMQNKVVHILSKTFTELGARVIRFNFRGVGKSEGEFDNANGEQDDVLAVHAWVKQQTPNSPVWLAGFSFGAFICAATELRIQPERLVLVAPPVEMYPAIQNIRIATKDWILIQGQQDEIVSADAVRTWEQQQTQSARTIYLNEAGHFFHGQLNQLKDDLIQAW